MSEREELRFDAERVREQLRPTTEALGRMAREIAKLAPDTSAFRKAAASALRAAAGTPTHDTTEEDGDPINEMVAASYEAYPEQWQHKPCARMHRPGYACILPEGHALTPASAPDDAEGKG